MRSWRCSWCAVVALVVGAGGSLAAPPTTLPPPPDAAKAKSEEPAGGPHTPPWPPFEAPHAEKPGHGAHGHGEHAHAEGGHGNGGHGGEAHGEGSQVIFTGEYFLWAPRRRAQDFALVGTAPFGGPIGVLKSVEGSYDSGFRVGAGYRFCDGIDVLFSYTHYHTSGDDAILQAPPGQVIFPTLTHPAAIVQVAAAKADNSINMNLFDMEVGRRAELSDRVGVRVFGGPRFANLDQKFKALYLGGDVATDVVRRVVTFDGGGLRAGGEVTYGLFQNVGLYMRGSASLLTGRFRSSLSETANGVAVVRVEERFNKVIPIADMGVGLRFERGNLRLGVGYEFQNWFGMLEGFDFVDDAHPAKVSRRSGDLGFDGVVFRLEYLF